MPCGALNRTARSATIASAHPSFAYVETDATLKALAEVAAGIAFETKIADTAVKGATFAAKHAEVVGQTSRSAPEERRPASFRPRAGASRW